MLLASAAQNVSLPLMEGFVQFMANYDRIYAFWLDPEKLQADAS